MPNVTLFVEDYSPLLIYTSGWSPGTDGDRSLGRYSEGSYMTTNKSNEQMNFVFSGTAVQIYGAKRANYGQYQVTMNADQYPVRDASSQQDTFQTLVFNFAWPKNLFDRKLKMESTQTGKPIDLDFVSWTFPVGKDDEEVIISNFEESHPSFKYDSDEHWSHNTSDVVTFSGGAARVASSAGSSFDFTFEGEAISLYGPVGPTGADYTVTMDTDGLPVDLTSRKSASHPKTMLYHRTGLGAGTHKLTLTVGNAGANADANARAEFAIDYAEVYTTPSLRTSAANSTSSGSSLSNGAVAGIVVGSFIGLLLLLSLCFWAFAQRARKNNRPFHVGFLEKDNKPTDSPSIQPFHYSDASPPISPPATYTSGDRLLQNQVSFVSLSSNPNTAQLSPNGTLLTAATMNDSNRPVSALQPNTQEIVVPPRGYEKSRGLVLQPPPQGAQRPRQTPAASGAAGQTVSPVVEEASQSQDAPPVYTMNNSSPEAASFYTAK